VSNGIIPSYVFSPSAIEITSIIMAVFKGIEIVCNILLLKGVFDVSIILRVLLIIIIIDLV
jgi:hypothetical protein